MLHIRCRCTKPLAGPVRVLDRWPGRHASADETRHPPCFGRLPVHGAPTLEPDECVIGVGVNDLEGIWLSPDWLPGWRQDWPGLKSRLRWDTRKGPRVVGYGCCGADGEVVCEAGHPVGRAFCDCWAEHWLWLDPGKVERSDHGNGWWCLLELEPPRLAQGMLVDGRPDGTWEVCALPSGDLVSLRAYRLGHLEDQT